MKKVIKWVLIGVVVIIVIGAIAGGGKSGTSTPGGNNQAQEQQKTPETVTAQQIADDFDGNQVAAESKWNGKLVQFTANVSNITDTGISFTDIASKQFSMAQISCRVSDNQQLLSLKNGEAVTVKGVIGKQTIGVIDMNECSVVK